VKRKTDEEWIAKELRVSRAPGISARGDILDSEAVRQWRQTPQGRRAPTVVLDVVRGYYLAADMEEAWAIVTTLSSNCVLWLQKEEKKVPVYASPISRVNRVPLEIAPAERCCVINLCMEMPHMAPRECQHFKLLVEVQVRVEPLVRFDKQGQLLLGLFSSKDRPEGLVTKQIAAQQ